MYVFYGSILLPNNSRNLPIHSGWAGQAGAVTRFPSTLFAHNCPGHSFKFISGLSMISEQVGMNYLCDFRDSEIISPFVVSVQGPLYHGSETVVFKGDGSVGSFFKIYL